MGSPPLARGIPPFPFSRLASSRITPACAGNTVAISCVFCCNWDHPRLRGEYTLIKDAEEWETGSPPLARGILLWVAGCACASGITPACAGNTLEVQALQIVDGDHPRLRGEYHRAKQKSILKMGSPPLARGILWNLVKTLIDIGITPACAGNTKN